MALSLVNSEINVMAVESIGSVPISDTIGMWHDRSVVLSNHASVDMAWKDYCNQSALRTILLNGNAISHIFYVPDLTSLGVKLTRLHGTLLHCVIDILEALRDLPPIHMVIVLPVNKSSNNDDYLHQSAAAEILESALAAYGHLYHFPLSVIHMLISEDRESSKGLSNVVHEIVTSGRHMCQVVSLPAARFAYSDVGRGEESSKHRVIFTSYFTSSVDPQRAKKRKANQFQYMKSWYDSVTRLDVQAFVFYDDLASSFIDRVSTKNVAFRHVSLNKRSTNDARFYVWYRYLIDHPSISHVLLTDISDVEFQKDPFHLMDILGDWLYIGQDIDLFPNMESMPWLMTRLRQCFGDDSVDHGEIASVKKLHLVYNAGVIGGPRGIILTFLHRVINVLDMTPPHLNCNMAVINYVAHKYFDDHVFTGFPLTSRFMARQSNPKAVYVTHK